MQTFDEPKQPGSGCSKTLLWVMAIFGGGAILCCGGGGIVLYGLFRASFSQDPAKVREATATITEIEIPERFAPAFVVQPPFIGFKMAMYGQPQGNRGPMLMVMTSPNEQQMRQQMNQSLQQQGQGKPVIEVENRNERKVTVRGEERTAFIGTGMGGDGRKMVQAQVPFTSKSGIPAMLMMIVPEEEWKEEEFDAIVKSMK